MRHSPRRAQRGFIISAEAMLFVTILVLGTILGWVAVRDAANGTLVHFANVLSNDVPYFSDPNRDGTGAGRLEHSLEPCLPDDLEDLISEGFYPCAELD